MAKYSRMKRYQGLRESLDRETTQTQQPSTNKNLERLSRVASANQTLSHADQPQRKREENLQGCCKLNRFVKFRIAPKEK